MFQLSIQHQNGKLLDMDDAGNEEGIGIVAQNAIEDAFILFGKKPKCRAIVVGSLSYEET